MALVSYTSAALKRGLAILSTNMMSSVTLRAAAAPTTSYVATDHAHVGRHASATLRVRWSSAANFTSLEVKVQGSDDATNWDDLPQYEAVATNATPTTPFVAKCTRSAFDTPGGVQIKVSGHGSTYLRGLVKVTGSTGGTVSVLLQGGGTL